MNSSKHPHMVITHIRKPTGPDGESDVIENMVIVDRVTTNMWRSASVVIDLIDAKVVKNRFDGPSANQQVYADYMRRYRDDVSFALKRWGSKDPENLQTLKFLAKGPNRSTNA